MQPLELTPEQFIIHMSKRVDEDFDWYKRKTSMQEVTGIPSEVVKALNIFLEQRGFKSDIIVDEPVRINKNYKNPNLDPEWVSIDRPNREFIVVSKLPVGQSIESV